MSYREKSFIMHNHPWQQALALREPKAVSEVKGFGNGTLFFVVAF